MVLAMYNAVPYYDFDADEELDPDDVWSSDDGVDDCVPDHGLVLLMEAERGVGRLQVVRDVRLFVAVLLGHPVAGHQVLEVDHSSLPDLIIEEKMKKSKIQK